MHESQLHQENSFITLTYRDGCVPYGGSLKREHVTLFLKRLRRRYAGRKVSHFLCGEYGERSKRPHYHALLFGLDFADKVVLPRKSGEPLYRSEELEDLWGHGYCSIGAVTYESAAYCARYVLKKVFGQFAQASLEVVMPDGEILVREAEFLSVSLRPAIGKGWFSRFESDVFPGDFIVAGGRQVKVPRYYDKQLQERDAEAFDQVRLARLERGSEPDLVANRTPARLRVREELAVAKVAAKGVRNLEG